MTLQDLKPGVRAIVASINPEHPSLLSRMIALGIVPGERIEVLRQAPLGDPLQIKAGSTFISVRRADSALIDVAVEL